MRRHAFLAALVAALTLAAPSAAVAADWSWPVRGDVVTKYRNGDDPYAGGQHRGVDIAAPVGAGVVAATSGRVVHAGTVGSAGLTVTLRSADGRFDLSYLHLSAVAVREGDSVGQGDRLGAVGVSGSRSVAEPHLHFGVREAGSEHAYRDPLAFLPPVPRPSAAPDVPAAAPEPVPAAPPPAGASVHAPAEAPVPSTTPAPLPAPAPAGATIGAVTTGPVEGPLASLVPERRWSAARRAGAPAPAAPHGAVAHSPSRSASSSALEPRRGRVHQSSPAPGRGPRSTTGPVPGAAPRVRIARPGPPAAAGGGVDVAWLAALGGMIATALCLGRPERTRRVARQGRAAAIGLFRPLLGRA